jgi:hypothetical protein
VFSHGLAEFLREDDLEARLKAWFTIEDQFHNRGKVS